MKARFYIFMKQKTQKTNKYRLVIISLMAVMVFVSSAQASEINAENVVKYVNEARIKEGLVELQVSEKLTEVATAKVNDMVAHNYFAHTSPAGLTPWRWFELKGYDYKYAGENLAINFTTAEDQQIAWMKSPTHKKNILNVNYQEIGVAVAAGEVNGTLGIISVQEFGTLISSVTGKENKNFAPIKDKTLPDNTKFIPTVLSTGDQKINENLKENFDSVFIFETLEHVQDEEKTIVNINNLLNKGGYVFVGAPVEFGLFFFLKELGRLLILGKTNHSAKEMFFASIGKMKKVKRVIGSHKGYDYRNTIKLFEKESLKLVEKIYYPSKLTPYGVILVFKK